MWKKIEKYDIYEKIGQGSFGIVYRGVDTRTNENVAIKIISNKRNNPEFGDRLRAERKALDLLDHRNIIKLKDLYRSSNNVYIITEYCSGGSMNRFCNWRNRIPEWLGKSWIQQIADALLYLKQRRIMHRDLKLSNILFTDSEHSQLKIVDFGFAKLFSEKSIGRTILGTVLYMAPEFFNTTEYSYKAEIWSLGVISYQILVGRAPFECTNLARLRNLHQSPLDLPPDISAEARDFLNQTLTYDSSIRPPIEVLVNHPFLTSIYEVSLDCDIRHFLTSIDEVDSTLEESYHFIPTEGLLKLDDQINHIQSVAENYEEAKDNLFAAIGLANYWKNQVQIARADLEQLKRECNMDLSEFEEKIDRNYSACIDGFLPLRDQYGEDTHRQCLTNNGVCVYHNICRRILMALWNINTNPIVLAAILDINPNDSKALRLLGDN